MGSGKNAGWLARLADEDPDAAHLASVAEPPEEAILEPEVLFYREAFLALQHDRQWAGMNGTPSEIPFTAIDTYAKRYGIEGEAFDLFVVLIRAMDRVWLTETWKRQSEKTGVGNG